MPWAWNGRNIDLRLGYRCFKLNRDGTLVGVNAADDTLNISGPYPEATYRVF
ncbi:MAG: hypothetical protein ABIK15_16475 [Pseudomonadota bacterium]